MKSEPTNQELKDEIKLLKMQLSEKTTLEDYQPFFDNNVAIILLVNPDNQNIIYANEAAASFYGYTIEQLCNLKISDINTLTSEEIKIKIADARKNKQNYFVFKHRTSNGGIRDVEEYQTKLKLGNKDVFSIIVHDVTQRIEAENNLFLSEKRYREYFEKDISGVYTTTPEGKLIDCNNAFANMLGYTVDEIKQIHTSIHYSKKDLRNKIIDKLEKHKSLFNIEIELITKDGGKIHCIENVTGIFDNNNKLVQFQGYIIDISKRKKAENALKESEARFKRLFEDLGDAVYVTKLGGEDKGDILEVNATAVKQSGYSKKELLQMNIIEDLFVEGSGEMDNNALDLRLQENEIVTFIEKKRRKDGSEYWTEVTVTPIEFNGPPASLAINRDITNRILASEALEESEKKFRDLFEQSGDAFLIIKNRNFIDCNKAVVEMLGYKNRDEVINVHPSVLSPEFQPDGRSSAEKADDMMMTAINKGTHRFEWDHLKSNGEIFPVEVLLTAISKAPGNEIIHTVWRDISEQNKIKRELIEAKEKAEKNEKKFRELYEKSGDAIFIVENERFINCNQATTELFKYNNKEDFYNLHPSEVSPEYQPDGELSLTKSIRMMQTAIKNGTHRFDWQHKKNNGDLFPVEVLLTAISTDSKKQIIHAVCRDISEREKNKNELVYAKEKAEESDRLKSAFLANMSHEIRTPMNGILGFASLLKLPDLKKEQITDYVTVIEKSGLRMLNIINDIMDISKIEAGQMEVNNSYCNVNKQIDDIYSFFKPEAVKAGLELSTSKAFENEDAITYTDYEKLYAVLVNLIKNSIKYSNYGSINFGYFKVDNELVFFVRDTGIGIPKNRQDAIFERFVQADIEDTKVYEGAGLGLSISKAYVEMLNGRIWLESEEGKGSNFYFTIPYVTKTPDTKVVEDKVIETHTKTKLPKKLNILIADDEEIASSFLQIVLKDCANNIYYAKDGYEAINICKNNPDLDLILMDIKMPLLDGYSVTREIRKVNNQIKIIAQTAYALPGDSSKAIKAG